MGVHGQGTGSISDLRVDAGNGWVIARLEPFGVARMGWMSRAESPVMVRSRWSIRRHKAQVRSHPPRKRIHAHKELASGEAVPDC